MVMAVVCERMGWTYSQYLAQPTWFIQLLMLKANLDAEYGNKKQKHYGKVGNIRGTYHGK